MHTLTPQLCRVFSPQTSNEYPCSILCTFETQTIPNQYRAFNGQCSRLSTYHPDWEKVSLQEMWVLQDKRAVSSAQLCIGGE